MTQSFDLVIIGGGPGGYVAAIRASQLGMKVALVEKDHLGGICLNWGCIPTKALLRTSEIYHTLHRLKEFGLKADNISFDWDKVIKRSRDVAKQLSSGVGFLMKKNKVTVFDGHGHFQDKQTIEIQYKDGKKELIKAPHIIIATGARARSLPDLKIDKKLIWDYREAMVPDKLPKSLLVIGSGAIGIEFASFYRSFGVEVTVVELQDRILPVEDHEISDLAKKSFEKQGIKIHTQTTVKSLTKQKNHIDITLVHKDNKTSQLKVDRILLAVGIVANVEDLGLEKIGLKPEKGRLHTNEWLETSVKGVYAIGDVASPPWLAHKASHEGVICVEKIAGVKNVHPMDRSKIPGCTYSYPQIASVGLTEETAKKEGHAIKVGRFPFIGNGKAIALGEPEGLVKTIFDAKTGELLGAHMIGAEVTELIHGFTLARTLEATEAELIETIYPHPTLSEMIHESVLQAFGRALHI